MPSPTQEPSSPGLMAVRLPLSIGPEELETRLGHCDRNAACRLDELDDAFVAQQPADEQECRRSSALGHGREPVEVDAGSGQHPRLVRPYDPALRRTSARSSSFWKNTTGARRNPNRYSLVTICCSGPPPDESGAEPADIRNSGDAERRRGQRAIDVRLDRVAEEGRRPQLFKQSAGSRQQPQVGERIEARTIDVDRNALHVQSRASALSAAGSCGAITIGS